MQVWWGLIYKELAVDRGSDVEAIGLENTSKLETQEDTLLECSSDQ